MRNLKSKTMTNTKPTPESIQPRPNWVFVKPDEEDSKQSESGLIRPDSVEQEKKSYGTVLSVGGDIKDIQKGDRVIFGAYAGETLSIDDEDYKLLHNDDVVAKF